MNYNVDGRYKNDGKHKNIIEAASKIFLRNGFESFKMDQIAIPSSVSK